MYPAKIDIEAPPAESPPRFAPGRLWSLWDMLRAFGHEFVLVDRMFSRALAIIPVSEQQARTQEAEKAGKKWQVFVRDQLSGAEKLVRELPLTSGVRKQYLRTLKLLGEKEVKLHEGFASVKDLISRWRDDIEDSHFLFVSDPSLYADEEYFGEGVSEAFPSSVLEIQDAVRCVALEQGTAAVFHCMRALEPPLMALGAPFKVDVAANWNAALNDIEKAIRARDKKEWPNWKAEEPFYTEACTHFFMIKNAWRNHTMHLRLRFSTAEAAGILDTTGSFMNHLATRLSEPEALASQALDAS